MLLAARILARGAVAFSRQPILQEQIRSLPAAASSIASSWRWDGVYGFGNAAKAESPEEDIVDIIEEVSKETPTKVQLRAASWRWSMYCAAHSLPARSWLQQGCICNQCPGGHSRSRTLAAAASVPDCSWRRSQCWYTSTETTWQVLHFECLSSGCQHVCVIVLALRQANAKFSLAPATNIPEVK